MSTLTVERNERNVLLLTGAGHFATHFFELTFPAGSARAGLRRQRSAAPRPDA